MSYNSSVSPKATYVRSHSLWSHKQWIEIRIPDSASEIAKHDEYDDREKNTEGQGDPRSNHDTPAWRTMWVRFRVAVIAVTTVAETRAAAVSTILLVALDPVVWKVVRAAIVATAVDGWGEDAQDYRGNKE